MGEIDGPCREGGAEKNSCEWLLKLTGAGPQLLMGEKQIVAGETLSMTEGQWRVLNQKDVYRLGGQELA